MNEMNLRSIADTLVILSTTCAFFWWIDRRLRQGPLLKIHERIDEHAKEAEIHALRNCAHHNLMFRKLGVEPEEVNEAERMAGVGPKPEIR